MSAWAGYHRISRVGDRGDRLRSGEWAEETILSYAKSRGLDVEMLEVESDVSGGKVTRPILELAIRGVEEGRYAGIVVAQLDRLSRMDLADALSVFRRVEDAGGQVIAVAENIDAGTPEGRLNRNIWLSFGDMQLSRYKAQMVKSKHGAVMAGIWPSPWVPFGYTCERRKDGGDGRLYPDPDTRQLVAAGFEARAAGRSTRLAAEAMGVPLSTASKMLGNRVYLGELRLAAGDGLPEWVNLRAHEPLVSVDVWEAAQLNHPRPVRNGHSPALLAGIARCAGCRSVMSLDARADGKRTYRCKPNKMAGRCPAPAIIAASKLEGYIEPLALDAIGSLRFSADERSSAVAQAVERARAAETEFEAFQKAVSVAGLGVNDVAAGLRSRSDAIADARADVASARLAAGPLPDPGTLLELYPDMDVGERRHVLRGALGAVWVAKGIGTAKRRVRVVAAGFEPSNLPTSARVRHGRSVDVSPVAWDGDLPGEIRAAAA